MGRMGVQQTNPEIALDRVELAQEGGEGGAAAGVDGGARSGPVLPRVHAEEGRVLGDQVELAGALAHQLARFRDHALHGATAVPATNPRDDAERAGVVAALGDFDVRGVTWSEPKPGRVVIGDVGRPALDQIDGRLVGRALPAEQFLDDGRHFGDLVEPDESVDLVVQLHCEVLREPLGHAAGNDQLLVAAALAEAALAMRLEDVADRLFLRRVDERARVDDHHVGLVGVGHDAHAGLVQVADHDLGIDEILSAAERDEADFGHGKTKAAVG